MSLKAITVFLLCLGSMNSLSAAPLFKSITQPKLVKQKMQGEPSFTDFSGTWKSAKCMGGEVILTIENSSDSININGENTLIGTMTTQSDSGLKISSSTQANTMIQSAEWNADNTQIIFKSVGIEKSFAGSEDVAPAFDSSMYVDMHFMTLELDNEQLKLKINTVEYKDAQRMDSSHPTCVFTKE